MLCIVKLLNIKSVILVKLYINMYLELDNRSLIVINVAVIRSREYGDNGWEVRLTIPSMHFKSLELGLVSSNQAN